MKSEVTREIVWAGARHQVCGDGGRERRLEIPPQNSHDCRFLGIKHVVSYSGGKDSGATLGLALQRVPREHLIVVAADTGNEHDVTLRHWEDTERALGIQITRLRNDFSEQIARKRMFIARDQRAGRGKDGRKLRWTNKAKRRALAVLHPTGNPFLDLCLWKGRFPSRKAQFCTEELKRNVIVEFQMDLIDAGWGVVSWQGVRRDESMARQRAKKIERIGPRLWTFRPLVDWTALQVFAYCAENGIPINPLYLQGMKRVGCMPCINVGKNELREIADRFPSYLDDKADWERMVSQASKHGYSTFFHRAGRLDGLTVDKIFLREGIRSVIEWSRTSRGGQQYDLLSAPGMSNPTECSSAYGLCE